MKIFRSLCKNGGKEQPAAQRSQSRSGISL